MLILCASQSAASDLGSMTKFTRSAYEQRQYAPCSEVKERMKKSKADKQALKASQPKGGAKATKVMPKAGPKGAKR